MPAIASRQYSEVFDKDRSQPDAVFCGLGCEPAERVVFLLAYVSGVYYPALFHRGIGKWLKGS